MLACGPFFFPFYVSGVFWPDSWKDSDVVTQYSQHCHFSLYFTEHELQITEYIPQGELLVWVKVTVHTCVVA